MTSLWGFCIFIIKKVTFFVINKLPSSSLNHVSNQSDDTTQSLTASL